jgi:creatinine amidohydrolase
LSRLLAELPGSDVSSTLTAESLLVIPTGAIEHHGPHLPLLTDSLISESVAAAAVGRAAEAGLDVWQAPTLTITKSDEHSWAPGTLWLSATTLFSVLTDLGRSIALTPARKVVFLNGHGGNAALLQVANRELRRLFGLQTFTMPATRVAAGDGQDGRPDEFGMGIHAGYAETSLVMHLRPDLVDASRFARNVPEHLAGFEQIGFNGRPVTFGWLSDDFGPTGVVGDPTGANPEEGQRMFERSVDLTVAALGEIARFSPAASS